MDECIQFFVRCDWEDTTGLWIAKEKKYAFKQYCSLEAPFPNWPITSQPFFFFAALITQISLFGNTHLIYSV